VIDSGSIDDDDDDDDGNALRRARSGAAVEPARRT
jgi:hypothetical protein